MKKSKKIGRLLYICFLVIAIAVAGCVIIQKDLKEKSKELKQESKKYEITKTKTKSGKEIDTEYIRIEENKFYIKRPLEFKQLDKNTINKKYNGDVPNIVFSSEDTKINLAIKITENEMKNNKIKSYTNQMTNLLKESSKIISTKDYKIDGYNIGQIKLITSAEDTDIYNNMICFSYENKLIIITFNCTIDLQEEWQEVGDFLIDSLFFTE